MKLTQQLLRVAETYCIAADLSESRVSTLIFNDGKRLGLIREGRDLYTGSFEGAMQWFSDRWPADAADAWPLGVGRPLPQPTKAEAEQ